MVKSKPWFPYFKLGLFFVAFVLCFSTFLNLFDPHIERDPNEWGGKPTKKIRQIELLYKLLNKKQ